MYKIGDDIYNMTRILSAIQLGFHGILSIIAGTLFIYFWNTDVDVCAKNCLSHPVKPWFLALPFYCAFQIVLAIKSGDLYNVISERKPKMISKIWPVTILKVFFNFVAVLFAWVPNAYQAYFPRKGVYQYCMLELAIYLWIVVLLIYLEDEGIKKGPVTVLYATNSPAIDIDGEKEEGKMEKEKEKMEKGKEKMEKGKGKMEKEKEKMEKGKEKMEKGKGKTENENDKMEKENDKMEKENKKLEKGNEKMEKEKEKMEKGKGEIEKGDNINVAKALGSIV